MVLQDTVPVMVVPNALNSFHQMCFLISWITLAVNYKVQAQQYMKARTKSAQKEIVSEYGIRFSILTHLPYFDIVRMHVVDPMHNLLLGTPKHMMHILTQNDVISKAQFDTISKTAAKINVPRCAGRIPSKIASSFSGFTADQWRNWTTVYSVLKAFYQKINSYAGCSMFELAQFLYLVPY